MNNFLYEVLSILGTFIRIVLSLMFLSLGLIYFTKGYNSASYIDSLVNYSTCIIMFAMIHVSLTCCDERIK